jgi:transcriptional regulator
MGNEKADLLQGTVEMLVMRLLQSGPLNGWDMMQRVTAFSRDVLAVTPGSLYPALHRLEERGLVTAEWGASENKRRAKFYRLTAAGRRQLAREKAHWERFSGAVNAILRDA